MAITEMDLYPKPEWNYVFGLASYRDRIAVSSIYRMQKDADFNLSLERLLKICSHEIGHMFGLLHCIYFNCLMNGSNHLDESDGRISELCPVCLRKLQHSIGFDILERYKALLKFSSMAGPMFAADCKLLADLIQAIEKS